MRSSFAFDDPICFAIISKQQQIIQQSDNLLIQWQFLHSKSKLAIMKKRSTSILLTVLIILF